LFLAVASALQSKDYLSTEEYFEEYNKPSVIFEDGVIVMEKDNFNVVLDGYGPLMIHMYYNQW
jgi:hypothetical protein